MIVSVGRTGGKVCWFWDSGYMWQFHSMYGCLKDVDGDIIPRKVIDEVKTEQGEALVSFLRSSGLCLVNGRVGQDNFTCISSK